MAEKENKCVDKVQQRKMLTNSTFSICVKMQMIEENDVRRGRDREEVHGKLNKRNETKLDR